MASIGGMTRESRGRLYAKGAACLFGVPVEKVSRLCAGGKLRHRRVGPHEGKIEVSGAGIVAYLKAQGVDPGNAVAKVAGRRTMRAPGHHERSPARPAAARARAEGRTPRSAGPGVGGRRTAPEAASEGSGTPGIWDGAMPLYEFLPKHP